MGKLFGFVVAAVIALAAILVYTGQVQMAPGAIALYLIVDAISIAIRTANEDRS